jgi:ribosome-associated protein
MQATDPPPLPEAALSERFLAASGPGGQNVNKVATACQLRVDVFALGLAPDVWQRLKTLAGSKLTNGGELVITAQRFRTQEANRADARLRAAELIARAHKRPERRVATKPSRAAKSRRTDAKKARGTIKAGRAPVRLD